MILNDMLDVLRVVVMVYHSLQIRSVVVACRRACNLVMDLLLGSGLLALNRFLGADLMALLLLVIKKVGFF